MDRRSPSGRKLRLGRMNHDFDRGTLALAIALLRVLREWIPAALCRHRAKSCRFIKWPSQYNNCSSSASRRIEYRLQGPPVAQQVFQATKKG